MKRLEHAFTLPASTDIPPGNRPQDPNHDRAHHGSAYLNVRDADALYEEWSRPGIGGHTRPASPAPCKLREGSHTDPDGNLIRFGSPMDE